MSVETISIFVCYCGILFYSNLYKAEGNAYNFYFYTFVNQSFNFHIGVVNEN